MTVLSYESQPAADGIPKYRLYPPGAVSLATVLGSPLAGSILMAVNYRRMGQKASAWKTFAAGSVGTIALLFAGQFVPDGVARGALIGSLTVMYQLAKQLQGQPIAQHRQRGGKIASYWKAAGIGLACMVLIIGGVACVNLATDPSALRSVMEIFKTSAPTPPRFVAVSPTEKVYFIGDATESMAQTTADALKLDGVFDGTGSKSVFLKTESGTAELSFVVSATLTISPDIEAYFQKLGQHVAATLARHPLDVVVVDPAMNEKKRITIP
jgi:hypothetical protein